MPERKQTLDEPERSTRFYEFVWPQRSMILRSALMLTRDAWEADDLAQETLLKAFGHLETFVEGSNIQAWLRTILRNTWTDRLRSASASAGNVSLERMEIDAAAKVAEQPVQWDRPDDLIAAFSDREVIGALRELPDEIRWTLLLVDVEGLDQNEAADLLAVPVGTIKSRAHRGRRMLRARLESMARAMKLAN